MQLSADNARLTAEKSQLLADNAQLTADLAQSASQNAALCAERDDQRTKFAELTAVVAKLAAENTELLALNARLTAGDAHGHQRAVATATDSRMDGSRHPTTIGVGVDGISRLQHESTDAKAAEGSDPVCSPL